MQILEQLRTGALKGAKRFTLAAGLTEFPREIFTLADTLEELDLSGNHFTHLPDDFGVLRHLRVLFLSNNQFTELPAVLGHCKQLSMVGFKANRIERVPAEALPHNLRWLILTDNCITHLPQSIGQLRKLQKLMLAGNQLRELPDTLAQCQALQLLRVSANDLTAFPDVVLKLPQLAWLAFAGNPFCVPPVGAHVPTMQVPTMQIPTMQVPTIARADCELGAVLGRGASGVIYAATCKGLQSCNKVAIKIFKGEVTSDGYPHSELQACLAAGEHANLVKPLGHIHDEIGQALVMALVGAEFTNLGQPPSLQSCTRDTFKNGQALSPERSAHLIEQLQAVVDHLHARGVCHGDIYAHNVLLNNEGHLLLSDFGAASPMAGLTPKQQKSLIRIEKRALGFFAADLLTLCDASAASGPIYQATQLLSQQLLA